MVRCSTCNALHMRKFLQICLLFSMIWYCRFQSPAVSKRQDVRWCNFRWSIPLSIDYIWKSRIDTVISTPPFSYCIWNRYCQNRRRILPNFILFVWIHMVEFNRLPCQNDKMYDDVVFADGFRYPLTIFRNRLLIGLSRLLHAHIAYGGDTAITTAAFWWLSYCLHYLIRLNSIVCHVQTTRYTII